VPLRTTTTTAVISALTEIFASNGFPRVLISDNGPPFVSKPMTDFCVRFCIEKVEFAPYRPQSNGLVERLHRSLVPMIQKGVEKKGNWAVMVPLALYFIRLTPSRSTGVSPYLAVHGWEPTCPIQVLYDGWRGRELAEIDIASWGS